MMSNKGRVVVTGMGVVSPIGNSISEFRRNLFAGKSGIDKLTRLDDFEWLELDKPCPIKVAGQVEQPDMSWMGREARRVGMFTRYAIAAMKQVYDEELFARDDDPFRAGIILGTGAGGQGEGENAQARMLRTRRSRVPVFTICQRMPNSCSGKLAQVFEWDVGKEEKFKIQGDNYVISSACASSTHAIGEAFRKIRDGYLDVVIAGGAEAPLTPTTVAGFDCAEALTGNDNPAEASRPFDLNRDGFVLGEGAGIVVLESLEHAIARDTYILAELVGYGATDDAYHDTSPHPEAKGSRMAMLLALKDAAISPGDIGYINAHGTSTKLNDKIETLAIKLLYADSADKIPPISSTKSQIGHLIGAAGAVELIATVLALINGTAPPTINYETPDPECDLDYVPNEERPLPNLEAAMSNSFGFTGHNACLVVKRYEP